MLISLLLDTYFITKIKIPKWSPAGHVVSKVVKNVVLLCKTFEVVYCNRDHGGIT